MSKILSAVFNTSALAVILLAVGGTLSPPQNVFRLDRTPGRHEVFNLSTEVTDKSVSGLLSLLRTAREEDDITIYINSPGGSVEAGMPVLEAMQESKANHIEAVVTGMAASMAEGIALESDHVTMKPNTKLMFHYGDVGGVVLKESDMHSKDEMLANYMTLMDGMMHTQEGQIITKEGWDIIHNGGMYWVSASEFKRLGGDTFNGRHIQNVYIKQMISLISGFQEAKFIVHWIAPVWAL